MCEQIIFTLLTYVYKYKKECISDNCFSGEHYIQNVPHIDYLLLKHVAVFTSNP